MGVTCGRGEQRSEGLAPSYLRGAQRDCSQATNDSRRESLKEETQTSQSPRPELLNFQGASVSIKHNRTRPANVQKVSERKPRCLRFPSARPPGFCAYNFDLRKNQALGVT